MPNIENLLVDQDQLFRMPKKPDSNPQYLMAIGERLADRPQHLVLYGVFADDLLMAMAGGLFGKKIPLWTLCYVHTRKAKWQNYRSTTGSVIDALIDYAESKEIYRFEYVTALRNILSYHPEKHLSRLNRISERAKRYQYYTEAFIPKQSIPRHEYHWWLLGERVQETNMLIRKGELKEEYRMNSFMLEQYALQVGDETR